jgi:hypothetical protein
VSVKKINLMNRRGDIGLRAPRLLIFPRMNFQFSNQEATG